MLVIGLAGGVASGKSLVASCFEHFGAVILDADRVGHDVLKDPDVIEAIRSKWGDIVIRDGEIDRGALARIVFDSDTDNSDLEHLELITHPRIGQKIREQLDQLAALENPAVVLDAPIMFKSGWDQMCDKIVFVDTDVLLRQQRARQRGWDENEVLKREARQTPIEEKRARSTDVINNSKSKEETFLQARKLWRQWGLEIPTQLDSPASLFPTTKHPQKSQ